MKDLSEDYKCENCHCSPNNKKIDAGEGLKSYVHPCERQSLSFLMKSREYVSTFHEQQANFLIHYTRA